MALIGGAVAAIASWGSAAAVGMGAAVGGTVAGIAGAVAVGVVTGAVIGAATAVLTGGNILEGALRGALVGGVSAGVFSGLGAMAGTGTNVATNASTNATANLGASSSVGTGVGAMDSAAALNATVPASSSVGSGVGAVDRSLAMAAPTQSSATGTGVTTATNVGSGAAERSTINKILFDSEGAINPGVGKIASGVVEGAAKAMLTEEPESQSDYLKQVQALNVSGDFNSRVANIKVPTSWSRIDPSLASLNQAPTQTSLQQQPLTPQQIAALNAQNAEGASYARPV